MSNNNRRYNTKGRSRRRKKKIAMWMIAPLLILVLAVTSFAGYNLYKTKKMLEGAYVPIDGVDKTGKDLKDKETKDKPENLSILFLGLDESEKRGMSGGARTDAMILATFNEKEKTVKLVSIPRDSYVYLPTEGRNDKITHANAFGGVKGSIEAIEGLFDIPVDYYVRMNFYAFMDVIDALGGIQYDVPFELHEKNSEDVNNAVHLQPGNQTINGEQALALARTRKYDNDLERGKRQQELMMAVVKKSVSLGAVTKVDDAIDVVGENMITNLTFKDMMSFYKYISATQGLDVQTMQLEGADAYINRVYYFKLDDESVQNISKELKSHLGLNKNTNTAGTNEENSGS